jgi:hypothetical protein
LGTVGRTKLWILRVPYKCYSKWLTGLVSLVGSDRSLFVQLVSFLVRLRNYQHHVVTVGFSGGFPVAVVTTLLVYRGRISETCSYISSTVVGTTSGKILVKICSYCSITTDSIATAGTVRWAKRIHLTRHCRRLQSKLWNYSINLLINNPFRYSDNIF